MIELLLIGVGGLRRYVEDILLSKKINYKVIGYLDDNPKLRGMTVDGVRVIGDFKRIDDFKTKSHLAVICIGDKHLKIRKKYFETLKEKKISTPTLIHENTYISSNSTIGDGTIINSKTVINSNAKIGNNVVVSSGSIIEHDCFIGDHTFFGPGVLLGGGVSIGEMCLLGIGSIFLPKVRIGNNVIIGAGSLITKDIPDNSLVIGRPGRIIKQL